MTSTPKDLRMFEQRRARAAKQIRKELPQEQLPAVLLLFGTPEHIRNGDVDHAYRPDSDVFYLTGFEEPDAVCAFFIDEAESSLTMFVRKKDRDREIWTGFRHGVDGAKKDFGAEHAFVLGKVTSELPKSLVGARTLIAPVGRRADDDRTILDAYAAARVKTRKKGICPQRILDTRDVMAKMREIKDEDELENLREAARITAAGHLAAMRRCRPGCTELDLTAAMVGKFMAEGARRQGYNPIVASGENACVLHYVDNRRRVLENDLVLIDAGAEYKMYTADVTRTFPASGKYTKEQRELYDITLAAQLRAIEAVRPGNRLSDVDDAARCALAEGLVGLGLLEGDPKVLAKKVPQDKGPDKAPLDRFYPHGTSHYLGSDVHDAGIYHDGVNLAELRAGMVITVEPGIYVQPDDDEAPKAYRGIGIRIEDDILVTKDGFENLTASIPKEPDDVERLMSDAMV